MDGSRIRKVTGLADAQPDLRIVRIGDRAVPPVPVGSSSAPDLRLRAGTDPNAVPVEVHSRNVPDGATVQILRNGEVAATGTLTGGRVVLTLALPAGGVTVLQARATTALTASLRRTLPAVEGLNLKHLEVTAAPGGASGVRYRDGNGKSYTLSELQAQANQAPEKGSASHANPR